MPNLFSKLDCDARSRACAWAWDMARFLAEGLRHRSWASPPARGAIDSELENRRGGFRFIAGAGWGVAGFVIFSSLVIAWSQAPAGGLPSAAVPEKVADLNPEPGDSVKPAAPAAPAVPVPVPVPVVPAPAGPSLPTAAEALVRARLLHLSLDGALQVMHRDFFRRNDNKAIPSRSLADVFKMIEEKEGVKLRWLAAEETVMNTDHAATDAFQKKALGLLSAEVSEYAAVEERALRFTGSIVLKNECLKCHVPHRTQLADRFAALEITIPIAAPK